MVLESVLLLVALLALPGAAPRAGEHELELALEAWEWSLDGHDLVLRQRALRDLGAYDDPAVVEALLEHLPDAHVALRPSLRRVLANLRAPESLEELREGVLRSRDPLVREQVALAAGEGLFPGPEWAEVATTLFDDRRPEVRAAALYALGRLRHEPALPAVLEAASDGAASVRRQAPEALVRLGGSRSVAAVIPLLADEDWRVRAAAARALGDVRTQAAAQALVERLDAEQGRVREELLASLARLTGRSFGLNVRAWRTWLEQAGDDLLAPVPGAPPDEAASAPSVARYYGVPTLSTRFLVITDLSTSMRDVDPGGYRGPNLAGRTRLELTKEELRGLVRGLPSEVLFNLVTFSSGVDPWEPVLVPADARHRERALDEIESWTAHGGTNLFAALEHVLDLAAAEARGDRKAVGRAPDTVYLLTDGAPYGGVIEDMPLLLEYVAERNRELDLRFHTIALTSERRHRDFLVSLARANGGTALTPLE